MRHTLLPQNHSFCQPTPCRTHWRVKAATPAQALLQSTLRTLQHKISKEQSILHEVNREGVNACLWQRAWDQESYLQQMLRDVGPFTNQVIVRAGHVPADVAQLFSAGSHDALRIALEEDIRQAVQLYLQVMGYSTALVRLETVAKTTCSRWHADHVPVRGLITYCGPGTLFVSNEHVDRKVLLRTLGIKDTAGFAVKNQSFVKQAATGDLLLLKGEAGQGMQAGFDVQGEAQYIDHQTALQLPRLGYC